MHESAVHPHGANPPYLRHPLVRGLDSYARGLGRDRHGAVMSHGMAELLE